jgi:hypothetical protein
MNLPTFVGVGASRSGTTTVYDFLRRHPQVFVPATKELHYFTFNHARCGKAKPWNLETYSHQFDSACKSAARGEISPSYFWVPQTAPLIRQELGKIKILAMLRDPVQRAISDFQYSWKYGVNQVDFSAFVEQGLKFLQKNQLIMAPFHPSAILWKGLYADRLAEYQELFGRHNVGVWLLDELKTDPIAFRAQLCQFLGVDDAPQVDLVSRNARAQTKPVDEVTLERLRAFYRNDVDRCGRLLDRDLGAWL